MVILKGYFNLKLGLCVLKHKDRKKPQKYVYGRYQKISTFRINLFVSKSWIQFCNSCTQESHFIFIGFLVEVENKWILSLSENTEWCLDSIKKNLNYLNTYEFHLVVNLTIVFSYCGSLFVLSSAWSDLKFLIISPANPITESKWFIGFLPAKTAVKKMAEIFIFFEKLKFININ